MEVKDFFSEEETKQFAYEIAKTAKASQIYCLRGELGTGKTVFAKGFAEGLGIEIEITSPTFGIINEYYGNLNFYHFDVYRINSVNEMEDTGYEEYFYGDGVCLVEWADIITDIIPDDAIWISIYKDAAKGENYRKIEVKH